MARLDFSTHFFLGEKFIQILLNLCFHYELILLCIFFFQSYEVNKENNIFPFIMRVKENNVWLFRLVNLKLDIQILLCKIIKTVEPSKAIISTCTFILPTFVKLS